jgi:Lrp/AsnC family leucine-responsive transcriptional regulator
MVVICFLGNLIGGKDMPKSSKEQINLDEKKIIRELMRNSKESIETIARKCGFSRQKVWRVIKRLEENKTIWGYHAVVDDEKLGLKNYLLLIKKTNRPIGDVVDKIIAGETGVEAEKLGVTVEHCDYLHGGFDWLISFTAENIIQAKRFVEGIMITYQDYVRETCLLEKIFPLLKCGIGNPELKKLKEIL